MVCVGEVWSARGGRNIGRDVAGEDPCQDPGLEFEGPAIADLVVEEGVGQEARHALLVGQEEFLPSGRREVDGVTRADEVVELDHAIVDGLSLIPL